MPYPRSVKTGIKLLDAPTIACHLIVLLKQITIVQSAPQAAVFWPTETRNKIAQSFIAVIMSVVSLTHAYIHWFTPPVFLKIIRYAQGHERVATRAS